MIIRKFIKIKRSLKNHDNYNPREENATTTKVHISLTGLLCLVQLRTSLTQTTEIA